MANFFRKLLNLGKTKKSRVVMTAELECLCQFEQALNSLLKQDKYIARSDYKDLRDSHHVIYYILNHITWKKKTLAWSSTYSQSRTFSPFCMCFGRHRQRTGKSLS